MRNKKILTLISLLLFLFLLVGCMLPPINHAPVITTTALPGATVGTAYTTTVAATDADDDALAFSLVSGPTDMVISEAGVISGWTPTEAGTEAVTVAVTDGKDSVSADFTITVTVKLPNTATDILTYIFEGAKNTALTADVTGTVDDVKHTVGLTVPYGTDVTALVATFTLSDGATTVIGGNEQISGVTANDFITTGSVTYIITAEDEETTEDWEVTVTKAENTATDILTYSILGVEGTVDDADHIVALDVPFGTPVTNLKATFTLSDGAVAEVGTTDQVSGVTANDFTDSVIYTITAEDISYTQDWEVTVEVAVILIDGVLSPGEWDGATEIPITGGMGTVRVLATTDYLYVAFDVDDETDARTDTTSPGMSDKFGINVNPTEPSGMPCELIFQIAADPAPFGGTSSGQIDGFETYWGDGIVQELTLPADLESVTLYGGGRGITEWKIPLVSQPGGIIKVGGYTDIENDSYGYPTGLDWSDVSTYADIVVY